MGWRVGSKDSGGPGRGCERSKDLEGPGMGVEGPGGGIRRGPGRTRQRIDGYSKGPEGPEGEVEGLVREHRNNLSAGSPSSATPLSAYVVILWARTILGDGRQRAEAQQSKIMRQHTC